MKSRRLMKQRLRVPFERREASTAKEKEDMKRRRLHERCGEASCFWFWSISSVCVYLQL